MQTRLFKSQDFTDERVFSDELDKKSINEEISLLTSLIETYPEFASFQGLLLRRRLTQLRLKTEKNNDKELETDLQKQIDDINSELSVFYRNSKEQSDEFFYTTPDIEIDGVKKKGFRISSPRFLFLTQKRKKLVELKKLVNKDEDKKNEVKDENSFFNKLKAFFYHIKDKISNTIGTVNTGTAASDDLFYAIVKPFLPAHLVSIITFNLVGSTNFIQHLYEGIGHVIDLVKTLKKKTVSAAKTIIHGLATTFAGTGIGLALTLLITQGAIQGSAYMLLAMQGLLFGINVLNTIETFKAHTEAVKKESATKKEYEDYRDRHAEQKERLEKTLSEVRAQKADLQLTINDINKKIKDKSVTEYEYNLLKKHYRKEINRSTRDELVYDHQLHNITTQLEAKKQAYEKAQENRLKAGPKLLSSSGLLGSSYFTLSGIALGAGAAILGGSVASLGALPLALIITGVVTGMLIKIDESNDYKFSIAIKNGFINAWTGIKNAFSHLKNWVVNTRLENIFSPTSPSVNGSVSTSSIMRFFEKPPETPYVSPNPNLVAKKTRALSNCFQFNII